MRLAVILILISFKAFAQDDLGLQFIENKGQWAHNGDFQANVPGGRMSVSAEGFSILLMDMEKMEHSHKATNGVAQEFTAHRDHEDIEAHFFKIKLVGGNRNAQAIAQDQFDGAYNYFIGKDTCRWTRNAKAYGTIIYKDVYEGIDLRVSSVGKNLKYDFIVRPGADPSKIKLDYDGVNGLDIIDDDLEIKTSLGNLKELKPISYHEENGRRQNVPAEYQLGHNTISFFFPENYDECKELVIDPLLIFSTYSGSTADNWGSTATPGEHGTLYSAGVTNQNNGGFFPTTTGAFQMNNNGMYDMAIMKYDSAGTRFIYATLLGGSRNDSPQSLVVDKTTNELIVLGISSSIDYPMSPDAFDDSFNGGTQIHEGVLNSQEAWDIVVTRLSPNGDILIGSTFLGGSGNDGLNYPKSSGGALVVNYGDEMRGDVITDDDGNVYVSSVTSSGDFPIVNGFQSDFNSGITDGIVVKLTPDLSSIIWSTYIGGSGFDAAYSIKFDEDNNIIVAGGTSSDDFPVTAGAYQTSFGGIVDGWIARLSADGTTLLNGTYTGTISFDQIYFVDLNSNGSIYCYGQTAGDMPVTPGLYTNPGSGQFLQKFSSDLSTLELSTVFGSGKTSGLTIPNISPTAFLVNDCNNIYMAGWGGYINSAQGYWQSRTNGMPITADAHQKTTSGSDFYFIVLDGEAKELVYATYFGGTQSKTHVDGGTSRFDKYGIVYHAVCSGCSSGNTTGRASSDFPTTPNAHSRLNRSINCNNAAFKFDLSSLRARFETNNTQLTNPGFNNVCYPDSIVFENLSTGGRTIEWDFGDGTVVHQTDQDPRFVIHQYQEAGQYRVKLKITDLSTCSQSDSTFKIINYFKDNIQFGEDALMCDGTTHQLTASGGETYTWTLEDGTFVSSEQNPIVSPVVPTTYHVHVVDENGCSKSGSMTVSINPNVKAAFETYDLDFTTSGYNDVCHPELVRFKNQSTTAEELIWSFGDNTTLTQSATDTLSPIHAYAQEGTYFVKLKAVNPNTCNKADSVIKPVRFYKANIQVGDDGEICEGTSYRLTASGGVNYTWTSEHEGFRSTEASPFVRPAATTKYFVSIVDSHNCTAKDTVIVSVLDSVKLDWTHRLMINCSDRPLVVVSTDVEKSEDVSFWFDFGDGTTSSDPATEHSYDRDGWFDLKFSAQRKFCLYEETVPIPVYGLRIPNVFTPDDSPGFNDYFQVGLGPDVIMPATAGVPLHLMVLNRWGRKVYESADYKNDWKAEGLEPGVYYIHLRVGEFATCKSWLHVVK